VNGATPLSVRRVTASDADGLEGLFRSADCSCFCQYWGYAGDHRDWQLRLASAPDENARGLRAGLLEGRLSGVLAEQGERVVGWSRLAPPRDLERLYQGRLYKGLPCFAGDRSGVFTVACLLVDPALRRRGIARALIAAQLELGLSLGARAIEAFPRGASDVSDGEQWMGPSSVYRELGFELVHDFPPYPVFRKHL